MGAGIIYCHPDVLCYNYTYLIMLSVRWLAPLFVVVIAALTHMMRLQYHAIKCTYIVAIVTDLNRRVTLIVVPTYSSLPLLIL